MTFPFEKLPPELIIKIFKVAVQDTKDNQEKYALPVTFASINRQMRYIAISTPQLWSSFSTISRVHLQYHLFHHSTTHSSCLSTMRDKIWHSRSGQSPIDLRLDLRDPMRLFSENEHCKEQSDFFDAHTSEISRWQSVQIMTDMRGVMRGITEKLSTLPYAPRLKSIQLIFFVDLEPVFLDLTRSIPTGPVSTSVVPSRGLMDGLAKFFTNLTHLEIASNVAEVLHSLPSLRTILSANRHTLNGLILSETCVQALDSDADPDLDPIILPELRGLGIGFNDVAHCVSLLAQFSAPGLRLLELRPLLVRTMDSSPVLAYLAQRDKDFVRHVDRVVLRRVGASQEAFGQFFGSIRNLREVVLHNPPVNSIAALFTPMAPLSSSSGNKLWVDLEKQESILSYTENSAIVLDSLPQLYAAGQSIEIQLNVKHGSPLSTVTRPKVFSVIG